MTGKTLKEMVGGNLRVDLSEDGFTVTNGAGTAHYDKWGYRTTVNGIPEYFPVTFAVSGWDNLPKKQAADCKKRFAGSEPLPFGGFPGAKLCQAQVAKPQPPETITTKAVAFGVTISWEGSNNIPYESRIQVQWIKDDHFLLTTDHKVVSSEKSHTITGLKAGEEIYCRLRVVSASGQKSEWSGFVKQAASSDAQEIINNAPANYSASMRISVNTASESAEENRIKKLVTETVTEHMTKMLQPGGLLSRK